MADNSKTIVTLVLLGATISLSAGQTEEALTCKYAGKTYQVGEEWGDKCNGTICECKLENGQARRRCTSSSHCPRDGINCPEGLVSVSGGECECATCEPKLPEPTAERLCSSIPGCAHYHTYDHEPHSCCLSCRVTISRCLGVRCPPVIGCMRYAKEFQDGECCLRCARRRKNKPIKGGVCGPIVCPLGQVCTNRDGVAKCVCKTCGNKHNPVVGSDGVTYQSYCHLQRAGCMNCKVITQQ